MTADDGEKRSLKAQGRVEFDRAHFGAFWSEMRGLLTNKSVGLLNFDEVKARLHLSDQSYRGLENIPLNRIVGSVGRYKEFTRNFLPKRAGMADRWSNVYAQVNSMTGVPPIDVFQVDDVYFVRDGNHRVSIARQMGARTIEAYVTELYTPINLEPDMSKRQFAIAEAYADFLEKTSLNVSRPNQQRIQLSEPHSYHDLYEHVMWVKHVLSARHQREVSIIEAAAHWYDKLYSPTLLLIRQHYVMAHFPRRTESDLYVWIVNHMQRLWERYGTDADINAAMVDFLAENSIPVPKRLITDESPSDDGL